MKQLAQVINFPGENGSQIPLTGPIDAGNFDGNLTIGGIIGRAVPFVFAIAGVGLLIMIIFSGFTLLTSAGNPKQTEKGKQQLTMAVIGFIVIFVAYWITQLTGVIFGIDAIQSIFG